MQLQPHSAECNVCGWQRVMFNENESRLVAVLHTLLRHPEDYHWATGKDPKDVEVIYRDYIEAYRSKL